MTPNDARWCPKFSKFVHGTATLYQGQMPIDGNASVRELP